LRELATGSEVREEDLSSSPSTYEVTLHARPTVSALVLSCKLWIEGWCSGATIWCCWCSSAKTGDIIQGLPRIERVEARKPKEACILARESGVVEISRSEDEAVGVRVEDSGRVTEYPIGLGQNVALSDGTAAGNAAYRWSSEST